MRGSFVAAVVAVLAASLGAAQPAARATAEIHVPQDAATLQLAIAQAQPGDTIVLDAGTYPGGSVVPAGKHDITIVGVHRNDVVLDGADRRKNGILVRADGVSILNLSAHNFLENAFHWVGGDRFRASYLTAWNVRGYGIYVEDAQNGVIDHSYVSGAADAAYYIGECRPCRATIANVVAERSAVGYSGTNSSGVLIRDSVWRGNGAGIVANTYANEALPPEARTTLVRNAITRSGRERVPIRTALAGFVGVGVALAGGNANVVRNNRVSGSERYGIAVFSTARYVTFNPQAREPRPRWRARDNRVTANVVSGSGRADLALGSGAGPRNCFAANKAGTTLPRHLQTASCAAAGPVGDRSVASLVERRVLRMFDETLRRRRPPPYTSLPAPPPQPGMPSRG
jgi:Right handed beta helix region